MKINNPESVYYWCHKNKIPVFCPSFTDGGMGDALVSSKIEGFIIDVVKDRQRIEEFSMDAHKLGAIICGSGIVKHHILNSSTWREGLDYAVYINTAIEYDASDSGAMVSEGLTWYKIQHTDNAVKIYSEASLIFPVLVAMTFF